MGVAEKLRIKDESRRKLKLLEEAAQQIILNKEEKLRLTICTILAEGHMLIEDLPGMGKTTLVKVMGRLMGLQFQRIQFTNDMLPADIIGSSIFDEEKRTFEFFKGPIFSELVLADEVNRATPKTQSACLQAMEENQISVDGHTYDLPQPFILIATQNPKQNIGTFPLPESQLDRFLMKINLGFPNREAEKSLLLGDNRHRMIEVLQPVIHPTDVIAMQEQVKKVKVSATVVEYLQNIVDMSRSRYQGLSPRAALGIIRAGMAWAYIDGRDFVVPEDIQVVGEATMNHRLSTSDDPYGSNGIDRAKELLQDVPVP